MLSQVIEFRNRLLSSPSQWRPKAQPEQGEPSVPHSNGRKRKPINPRVAEMIDLRDKQLLTLEEIGERYGISRERVRQLIGNTGHGINVKALAAKKTYWAKRLYGTRTITRDELAKTYRVAPKAVIRVVGTKLDYESRTGLRRCSKCQQQKPFSDFYRRRKGCSKLASVCKACSDASANRNYHNGGAERKAEWQRANREKVRAYQRDYYYRKKANGKGGES